MSFIGPKPTGVFSVLLVTLLGLPLGRTNLKAADSCGLGEPVRPSRIDFVSKSGSAYLCGFPEFTSPSSPPRFYKTKSKTGTITIDRSVDGNCDQSDCVSATVLNRARGGTAYLVGYLECSQDDASGTTFGYCADQSTPVRVYRTKTVDVDFETNDRGSYYNRVTYHGTCSKDRLTGAGIGSIHYHWENNCPPGFGGYSSGDAPTCSTPAGYTGYTTTYSKTQRTYVSNGGGWYSCAGYFWLSSVPGTTGSAVLSDEDTEQDAIARLLLAVGNTWPRWEGSGEAGAAGYRIRTGLGFVYYEGQFRVEKSGLLPNRPYRAKVDLWRRTNGVGAFAFYQTKEVSGTTDASGNLLIDNQSTDRKSVV